MTNLIMVFVWYLLIGLVYTIVGSIIEGVLLVKEFGIKLVAFATKAENAKCESDGTISSDWKTIAVNLLLYPYKITKNIRCNYNNARKRCINELHQQENEA